MDILFGLSMQKSGVIDTMGDLIVDAIGAGYWYLKRGGTKFLPLTIEKFVEDNPHVFEAAPVKPDLPDTVAETSPH